MGSLWARVFVACAVTVLVTLGTVAIVSTRAVDVQRRFELVQVTRDGSPGERGRRELHLALGPPPAALAQAAAARTRRTLWIAFAAAALAALAVTLLLVRSIVGPLSAVAAAARRVAAGDLAARAPDAAGEVGALARDFNAMAGAMERTERMRTELLRDVAHELRAPLTALRCRVDAVRDGVDVLSATTIDEVSDDLRGLERLVDDLQQVALAREMSLAVASRPVAVLDLVDSAVRAFAPLAASRDVELRVDVPAGIPAVRIDADRIRQVIGNLLDNALRHTARGGHVAVAARASGDAVEITVSDDGEGFPAHDAPLLFERLYRTDPSRSRRTGGTGLGLSIARQFVEAHGGTIRAESGAGRGATFRFTVPASRAVPSAT